MKNDKQNQLIELNGKALGELPAQKQDGRVISLKKGSMIDYATTNYLGWDFHPHLFQRGSEHHQKWGSLSGWSRLEIDAGIYRACEDRLKKFIGCKDIILSHTITVTNFSIIPAIAKKGTIFCDQKVHTVVWEACRLARDHGADLQKFNHQDTADLEKKLASARGGEPILICVDGVYSISSEVAPILELQRLCEKYGAWLLVDDAHGFGILGEDPDLNNPYGKKGNGVVHYCGGNFDRTFYVSSMGKAFCTHTAFVTIPDAYPRPLREECLQYIYSAPMPPFVIGMVEAALDLNEREGDSQRKKLYRVTKQLVTGLTEMGLKVQNTDNFPIVFWEIGALADLARVAKSVFGSGVVAGIRAFPVVPPNECGLRFGLTALHSEEQIKETLRRIESALSVPAKKAG